MDITSLTDMIYGSVLDLTDEGGTSKAQSSATCVLPADRSKRAVSTSAPSRRRSWVTPGDTETDIGDRLRRRTTTGRRSSDWRQRDGDSGGSGADDHGDQDAIAGDGAGAERASVTFTVRVDNTSHAEDPVEITSLTDTVYGDLLDLTDESLRRRSRRTATTCVLPQTVASGGFYACTFTATVSGNAGDSETNIGDGVGPGRRGGGGERHGERHGDVTGVAPTIAVTKTPSPIDGAGAGGLGGLHGAGGQHVARRGPGDPERVDRRRAWRPERPGHLHGAAADCLRRFLRLHLLGDSVRQCRGL